MNNFTKNLYKNIIFNKNIKYELKENNIDYSILGELKYIDNSVINYIYKYIKYSYKIEYNNTTLILNSKSNKICKKLINNILNVIDNTRNLMKNNKHLNIILYLTDLKKRFPVKKNIVLGPKNVNSGVTIHYIREFNNNGTIILYRKEEVIKVLIHEIIHSFKCDYELFKEKYNKFFFNQFNFENDKYINTNESYVEVNALIIFLIMKIKKNNEKLSKLNVYLNQEKKYSLMKMNQILDYYNITNLKGNISFKQNSNIFSYYITKTGLLVDINKFFKFMENINNLKLKNEDCINYINLIINTTNNLNNNYIKSYKKYKDNSLRMIFNNM
jgi:hypothetical protein